jgi:RNA polymerase sigma-70 factor (ECF subfamily)
MHVDEQILQECIQGKRKAQKMLFDAFSPAMLAVCMRYCNDRDEAEDVLQEAFIKVFQNLHTFRKEGSLAGWIKRIIINHAINYNHKKQRHLFLENIERVQETDIIFPDAPIEYPDELSPEILLRLVQELPTGYRTVFNLYIMEDYSHKEIGELLGISENTSKTQLLKARRWLRNRIEERKSKKKLL